MNPLIDRHCRFVGVTALVGGVACCCAKPGNRIEDRLDLLTGATAGGRQGDLLKQSSVLARPLDQAPALLDALVERFGNLQPAVRAGRHVADASASWRIISAVLAVAGGAPWRSCCKPRAAGAVGWPRVGRCCRWAGCCFAAASG